ncbi:hypothetical protein ACIBF6_09245 [Streptosporangium amethystogenes]|uniref:hypothetical protein n=1 Tax=Streptosporangium amethystogenes TaxID=2002 RepID=UPI00378932EA
MAADESGATGENLFDNQMIMAHATVKIDDYSALPIVNDLRNHAGILQPPELKFSQFNKIRSAHVLAEAFAPGGPLAGRVNIIVADKRYVAVAKIIDLLIEEWAYRRHIDLYRDGSARRMAQTFFRDGPRALGDLWDPLIMAFIGLTRKTQRRGIKEDVESFYQRLEEARWRCHRRSVEEVLKLLLETRSHAEEHAAALAQDTYSAPALDPLTPLITDNIRHWYQICGPFKLLHDEHSLLDGQFVQKILGALWIPHPSLKGLASKARVAIFATGRSVDHPSIQLADLAAGAGRVVIEAHYGTKTQVAAILRESFTPLISWGLLPDGSFWGR